MKEIPIDCPGCGMDRVGATPRSALALGGMRIAVFARCNGCGCAVLVTGATHPIVDNYQNGIDLYDLQESVVATIERDFAVEQTFPERPQPRRIEDLPEPVESSFREAEECRARRKYIAAAGTYRTTLERALKVLDPDTKASLYQRIKGLAEANAVPAAMIALMHEVRFLGNSIHEMDDPVPEDVEAGADFVALFLTYMFELPARVARAQAKRAAG